MDLSHIKMVVSDMDGTLLSSTHEISTRFFELFEGLKRKNIQFVAASGRQYSSMISKFGAIKDDIIFIAENGGYIRRKAETLLTTPLPHEYIAKVLEAVSTIKDAHPVLCSKDNAYANGSSDAFLKMLSEYYTDFEVVADQKSVTDAILKVAIYHPDSSEAHIYPAVQHFEGDLKVKVSGANWVDVSHQNANKGYALEQLMQAYQIKPQELLVFGDYNNDLEMLELAEYSFAMANAHPDAKAVANYETGSNDEHGVERILEKLV
ncbi:MAG: HAD family hydrolase [Bacteroidota bacterium]